MRKLVIALLIAMAMSVSANAVSLTGGERPVFQPNVYRIGAGYNYLLSPNLDAIADLPQSEVTRNGLSLSAQALLGNMPYLPGVLWGVEADYLTLYSYEIILPESDVMGTAFPVFLLWEYPFATTNKSVTPLLQWGLGLSFNATETDAAGAKDTERSTDLALMIAPGYSFRLSEKMHLATFLKYYFLNTPDERTQVFNINANLGWKF